MAYLKLNGIRIWTFTGISSFYLLQQLTNWPLLSFWGVKGGVRFGDMSLVLKNADCFKSLRYRIYESDTSNECVNYVYGSWLIRVLDFFHLGAHALIPLGVFATLALSWIFAHLLSDLHAKSKVAYILGISLIVSPPVMLLVERGNFDWLMFVLLYIAALLISRGKFYTSVILLSISALFKFYTLPVLIILSIGSQSKVRMFTTTALGIPVVLQILADLELINSIFIETWFAAFGNSIWAQYLLKIGHPLDPIQASLIGLGVCAIIYVLLLSKGRLLLSSFRSLEMKKDFLNLFSWFSVGTFIACFFAGMNYDYRLVFLLPVILLIQGLPRKTIRYSLFVIVLLIFWLSFNVKYLQPLGDIFINFLVVLVSYSIFLILSRNYRKVF
jgi:hypothetical protein